ncbi:MAG: hypothetical protein QNJ70_22085 [Xenococcaceae cyanobacterium MO_207.B15]|nr:hypothetical protein [Xenococcaceae cyanobacterium MO_207.B15]MDJ0745800.1 hypothetical protein [Xenococcaceae cyanobacterium MO_167.B27]
MSENTQSTVTPEQLAEVIQEFEQYRERLLNDTMETAKKAKLSKKKVMEQLQPQLDQIDGKLEALRNQYVILTTNS